MAAEQKSFPHLAWSQDDDPAVARTICVERGERAHTREEPAPSVSTGELRRGDTVGRYVIIGGIALGGMGVVFEAYDPELDRRIALKILRADDAEEPGSQATHGRERLLREAQALAKLSHPNVVAVYDVGEIGEVVFIAMELVRGKTVRRWLRKGEPATSEILDVFFAAGQGMAAAHAAGLIHRDFKPENVMLGDDGRVRVLDFGLARIAAETGASFAPPAWVAGAAGRHEIQLTTPGLVMGTPAYMAPEQLLGEAADEAADQYSFCVALYEALAGQRPFQADTPGELYDAILAGPPELPRSVPRALRAIVVRGLRSAPAERFPSMDALLDELRRFRGTGRRRVSAALAVGAMLVGAWSLGAFASSEDPAAVCAAGASRAERLWSPAERGAVERGFSALGLEHGADVFARVDTALHDYTARWRDMYTASCRATHVDHDQSAALFDTRMECLSARFGAMQALVDVLGEAPDATAVENAVAAVDGERHRLDACGDTAALLAAYPPPVEPDRIARAGELSAVLDRVAALEAVGHYDAALVSFEEHVPALAQLDHPPLSARAHLLHGQVLRELARGPEAEAAFRRGLEAAARARDDALLATLTVKIAHAVGHLQARHGEAAALLSVAEALAVRGASERTHILLLETRGLLARGQARYDDAMRDHGDALARAEALEAVDHELIASLSFSLATAAHLAGRHERAREAYERALAVQEQLLGPRHPHVGMTLNNLGLLLWEAGRHEDAAARLERALAIKQAALGPTHASVGSTLNNLGVLLVDAKRPAEALPYMQRALAIQEEALGADHPDVADRLYNLGSVLAGLARHDEALVYHRRAQSVLEASRGATHPDLAYPLVGEAEVLLRLGRAAEALPVAERALVVVTGSEVADIVRLEAQFAVAQALWETADDRSRAASLALQVRAQVDGNGPLSDELRAEVDAWLAEH